MDPSDILLTDQVAFVTGGGGGIGAGIAEGMARFGAHVAIVEIDPQRAEDVAAKVRELGREAIAIPTDVMDTDQIRAAVEQTKEKFGRIDILVNNAGGVRGRRFLEQSERSWRRHVDINMISMFAATHAIAPIMIEGGRGGSIVNITSIEGSRAAPMFSVYAACKAGMISFTRTMALELGEHNIRVNAIAPDQTITPGNHGQRTGPIDTSTWLERPKEIQANLERYVPLGREGIVEECASAAVFLSSKMSDYITGNVQYVDGGCFASSGWVKSEGDGWELYPGFNSSTVDG